MAAHRCSAMASQIVFSATLRVLENGALKTVTPKDHPKTT